MLITALAVQLRREAQKLEARREAVQRERARTLLEPSTAKSLVIPLRMSELTTFDGDTANGDADMYIAFDEETDSGMGPKKRKDMSNIAETFDWW